MSKRALVLLGVLLAGVGTGVGTASAEPAFCDSYHAVVQMGPTEIHPHRFVAPIQILPRPGPGCVVQGFPADWQLRNANDGALPNTFARNDDSDVNQVIIGGNYSARVLLSWPRTGTGGHVRPATLSLTLSGVAEPFTMPWTGGELPGKNTAFRYGAVQIGP